VLDFRSLTDSEVSDAPESACARKSIVSSCIFFLQAALQPVQDSAGPRRTHYPTADCEARDECCRQWCKYWRVFEIPGWAGRCRRQSERFQPSPDNFNRLWDNVAALPQVEAVHAAVESSTGDIILFESGELNVDHRVYDTEKIDGK
jgi:hypothetical protein